MKKVDVSRRMLSIDGMLLSFTGYMGIQFGSFLGVSKSTYNFLGTLILSGMVVIAYDIWDKFIDKDDPLMEFIHSVDLKINDKFPKIIKRTEKDNIITYVVRMPSGMCQKDFEKYQQPMEQWLRGTIKFDFNFDLIITVNKKPLANEIVYEFQQLDELNVYVGDTSKSKMILDIRKFPHAIIAGSTDSGKSSMLRNIILSLILSKYDLIELYLIDLQSVEFGMFENCKKVKFYGETPQDFEKIMCEMEEENEKRRRIYRTSKKYVVNLKQWNSENPHAKIPYKIVIIDEIALLSDSKHEDKLERLKARASADRKVGIHYIISLQRPDVKCLEGAIKTNFMTRIAFRTATAIDSRVILDQEGAEKITVQGRCLISYCGELYETQTLHVTPLQCIELLENNNCYKSKEEKTEEDRKKAIEFFHNTTKNPYSKK